MHDDLGAGISGCYHPCQEFLKQKVGKQHLKEDIDVIYLRSQLKSRCENLLILILVMTIWEIL